MAEYIEREKATCKNCFHYKVCGSFGFVLDPLRGGLVCDDFVNAADVVEVRHGEWLDAPYTYFGAKRYECSQCQQDEFWRKRYIEIKENYCPKCGAKMDGERRAEE